ncbi:MAG: hypothetical protein KDB03_10885 [Planctomycetales bacterium]|nr:hypothetical protein [Planctomycetales bacterium]
MNENNQFLSGRLAAVFLLGVIMLAFGGFILGITEGVGPPKPELGARALHSEEQPNDMSEYSRASEVDQEAIPATNYASMRRTELADLKHPLPLLQSFPSQTDFTRCVTCHNPHTAEIRPNETDKLKSLAARSLRRAYNGAPPIIPHVVERTNDEACFTCHGDGAIVGNRVANPMPHGRLSHCIQCHASPPPSIFSEPTEVIDNAFVGLPAPVSGPRAYGGAPPVIPHATWMRDRCLSCHGGTGWPGLEVTHRWRENCLQCHATSATLEQLAFSPQL